MQSKSKIYLFVPINIGRNLESLLQRRAPQAEFITPGSSGEELKFFEKIFTNPVRENIPELIVTLQPQILRYFEQEGVRENFESLDNLFPKVRDDLFSLGLHSPEKLVKPVLFVPIIMLVNRDVHNPPKSWRDLFEKRFHGKILLPDIKTPVSFAFSSLMKHFNDENNDSFFQSLKYGGLPFDVIAGVNKGFYDVGILPLPFARYNVGKNLATVIPREGAFVLPEMIFIRKDASLEVRAVARELFGTNIQRFFSQLGALIPVIPNIPLPAEIKDKMAFHWESWNWYKKIMIEYGEKNER